MFLMTWWHRILPTQGADILHRTVPPDPKALQLQGRNSEAAGGHGSGNRHAKHHPTGREVPDYCEEEYETLNTEWQ